MREGVTYIVIARTDDEAIYLSLSRIRESGKTNLQGSNNLEGSCRMDLSKQSLDVKSL
jgi:hypothetical protein